MIKEEVFIPLTYDRLFVSIFGNEECIDILEVLLEDIFDYIEIINIVCINNKKILNF